MMTVHPTHPDFARAYGEAWDDAEALVAYFAPGGSYTDVAMGATYVGLEEIARFHRYMIKFAPDSNIKFVDAHASEGRLFAEWTWRGTFSSPLRMRSGALVDATGTEFEVLGVAACAYDSDGKLLFHRDYWDLTTVLEQANVNIGGSR